jgi:type IV secretion system protein VirD4
LTAFTTNQNRRRNCYGDLNMFQDFQAINQTVNPLTDPVVWVAGGVLLTMGIAAVRGKTKSGNTGTEHGSAGWAKAHDIKELLVPIDSPLEVGSLMIGPWSSTKRVDLHRELVNRNIMIAGPPGTGKSRGFFLWNCAHYKGSFIATDPKFELFKHTSGYHQRVRKYAPRDPDASEAFNWIPLCGQDAHLCLALARAVVTSEEGGGGGHAFYVRADTAFMASLFAHASSLEEPTPAAMYDFLTSHPGDLLTSALLNSPNAIARQFATIFSQADPKTRGSIIIGCGITLVWLADEKVRRFTSSTVEPPDFRKLREEPTAVYWCLQENDIAILKPLSTIFFTLCLHQLKQAEGDVPINFLLDEFANIGKIPNIETEIAVLRGRGIGLTIGLQSISQLEAVYSKAIAKVILDSINTKIVLAGLDYTSAEFISQSLGDATVYEERVSKSSTGSFLGKVTTTKSKDAHAKRLLTADELRRIGTREQVIITTNMRPMLTKRFWYTTEPRTAKVPRCGEARTVNFEDIGVEQRRSDEEPPVMPANVRAA